MRPLFRAMLALILAAGGCPAASAECNDLDWQAARALGPPGRGVTSDDLARLRDIGPAFNELSGYPLFTLSPDRTHVAFQLRRSHPETNSYCLAIVVLSLAPGAAPIIADQGGTMLRFSPQMLGQGGPDTGIPMVITPRWAPDGSWVAFLKQVNGVTQLWRATTDGRGSQAMTDSSRNVVDFRVVDSVHLALRYRERRPDALDPDRQEALAGFHYDDRFMPLASSLPVFATVPPEKDAILDVTTGADRPVAFAEIASLFERSDDTREALALSQGISLTPVATSVPSTITLSVIGSDGRKTICETTVCGTAEGPSWWNDAHDCIRFFRRTGWGNSRTEIVEWRPGSQTTHSLYSTEDYLVECQPRRADQLVCLRETSMSPRHLVVIDLHSRRATLLADFNPEFRSLTLGAVTRMRLNSEFGIKTFADLVLPVGYVTGRRYPLIVVQYVSRGFLRGGIGDQFPIQAYASRGYAVLSVQRPAAVGTLSHPPTWREVDRINLKDFADRRNVLSVVEQGVKSLVRQGIVDPTAVGITGLSDGSSTVQFAAIHSRLFSAGIVSGCCWERGQDALLGPKADDLYRFVGWPPLTARADSFWAEISLSRNASRVAFPILFDMADDEFRLALESYVSLRESGKPADMFVYPGEHHIKWQPAHRLSSYQRSIAWFDFWLRSRLPTDPELRKDAERWIALKGQSAGSVNFASEARRAVQ